MNKTKLNVKRVKYLDRLEEIDIEIRILRDISNYNKEDLVRNLPWIFRVLNLKSIKAFATKLQKEYEAEAVLISAEIDKDVIEMKGNNESKRTKHYN